MELEATTFLSSGEATGGTWTKYPHPDVRIVGSGTTPGAGACYLHRDHLASIRIETNEAGALGRRQRYLAYGTRSVPNPGTACAGEDKGFIGERHDDSTGLIYLNARWYDPELSRFVSPDWWDPVDAEWAMEGRPIGIRFSPVGMDRYAYAANDPINKTDTYGHFLSASYHTSISADSKAEIGDLIDKINPNKESLKEIGIDVLERNVHFTSDHMDFGRSRLRVKDPLIGIEAYLNPRIAGMYAEGKIWINPSTPRSTKPPVYTALHELGHFFGLGGGREQARMTPTCPHFMTP